MKAAPVGAFGAMAYTIGKYGPSALGNLAGLIATFYLTSALFIFIVLGLIARVAGFSLLRFLAYIKDELLLVLGTSSSESALPQLMEKLERLGCSKSVVGLVVPTGYSFNLDGTNIYMTLTTLFIARAMGAQPHAVQMAHRQGEQFIPPDAPQRAQHGADEPGMGNGQHERAVVGHGPGW